MGESDSGETLVYEVILNEQQDFRVRESLSNQCDQARSRDSGPEGHFFSLLSEDGVETLFYLMKESVGQSFGC